MTTTTNPTAAAPTQRRLAELLAQRSAWVGSEARRVMPADAAETTVLVLLRRVDLGDLVAGAREFTACLTPDEADTWRRSWTKTRFLFGNPANLTRRAPARLIGPGGNTAWLGPFPSERLPGLSRLLKPVSGVLPDLPPEMTFPAANPADGEFRDLHIAVRGLTFAEYLVHLHHTLAESVLLGRLNPNEPVRLIHRQDIGQAALAHGDPGYARVHYAPGESESLRLYTWLCAR